MEIVEQNDRDIDGIFDDEDNIQNLEGGLTSSTL